MSASSPTPRIDDDPERSEYDKLLAGEWYRYRISPELADITARHHEASRRLTEVYRDSAVEGLALFREIVGAVGEGVDFRPPFYIEYGQHMTIGRGTFVNTDFLALGGGRITIGEDVLVGPNVRFYTSNHPLDPELRRQGYERAQPITVGDNVWFGGNVTVLPGVTIGADSVIAAGSVVTKDVPERVVVGGNPARVLREL